MLQKVQFAKDTVSSTPLHSPVSRDSADRQDGQGDDEICHNQHEQSLEKASMTNDKTCNRVENTHITTMTPPHVPPPPIHGPVRRKRMMLNIDRMVGTITPKKVLSLRGPDLEASSPAVDDFLESALSPNTLYAPWGRRRLCSPAMTEKQELLTSCFEKVQGSVDYDEQDE